MASLPPHTKRTPGRTGALAILATCVLVAGGTALAQQQPQLRGAVLESEVAGELLGASVRNTDQAAPRQAVQDTGLQPGSYSPLTPSAVTDLPGSRLDDPLEERRSRQEVFADDILGTPVVPSARADMTPARRAQPTGVASPREARAAADEQEELTTSTVRASPVDFLDEERNTRVASENTRQSAIEGLARARDDDPYAPLGIRAGTFVVTPTLEQGLGWTSNSSSSPGGGSSLFSETSLRLNAISDWSRHTATVRADGSWRKSVSGEDIDELEGGIDGELRLDLANDLSALAALGYRARPESASSPVGLTGVASQPLRHSFTGAAGLSKDVGKVFFDLRGDVARTLYDDARLAGGGRLSQRHRDNTLATATLRGGYELSPALRPFAEVEIGRRFYDRKYDAAGYRRSADRYGVRAGVELDLGEKLSGEFSAGWLTERPDDNRLASIEGLSLEGTMAWSPLRGTTVELNGQTEIEAATSPGASGSILYSGSVAVSRQLRADLTGRALAGVDWRDYSGGDSDLIMRGELSLTWWMNRYAGITGRTRYERQESTLPGRDYDETSIFLGMTFQR